MPARSKADATSLVPLIALCFSGAFSAAVAVAQEHPKATEAENVVERLQKNYKAAVDFVADFQQHTEIKTLNRNLKARGKVYFKRPGKMLWDYDEPKGQWVLADGKSLYFYQPEQYQVLKSPLKSAFRSDIPLSFLLGLGDLSRDFKVTVKSREEGHYILQLWPKGDAGALEEIELGVDRTAYDIQWARLRDAVGNVTTVRFANVKKGTGLNDSLFRPEIPSGVDIVELGS